jgi:hypothetical protein
MTKPLSNVLTDEKKFVYYLLHLHLLSQEAESIYESLKSYHSSDHRKVDKKSFEVIWISAMNFILIKYLSFRTEFNEKKALIPNKGLQTEAKKIISHIRKKWPDMEDFRNEVLAHEFRRKGVSIFSIAPRRYNIPIKLSEYKELINAMAIITLYLKKEYPEQFMRFEGRTLFKTDRGKGNDGSDSKP